MHNTLSIAVYLFFLLERIMPPKSKKTPMAATKSPRKPLSAKKSSKTTPGPVNKPAQTVPVVKQHKVKKTKEGNKKAWTRELADRRSLLRDAPIGSILVAAQTRRNLCKILGDVAKRMSSIGLGDGSVCKIGHNVVDIYHYMVEKIVTEILTKLEAQIREICPYLRTVKGGHVLDVARSVIETYFPGKFDKAVRDHPFEDMEKNKFEIYSSKLLKLVAGSEAAFRLSKTHNSRDMVKYVIYLLMYILTEKLMCELKYPGSRPHRKAMPKHFWYLGTLFIATPEHKHQRAAGGNVHAQQGADNAASEETADDMDVDIGAMAQSIAEKTAAETDIKKKKLLSARQKDKGKTATKLVRSKQ